VTKDLEQLYKRFYAAYKALRRAWLKTGGGMDMQIQIRDEAAERRSVAARKAAAKRKKT
jgi:hypothetical protein